MKKYIKPAMKAETIELETLIAESDPSLNNQQGNGSWHSNEDYGWEDGDDEDGWKWPK